MTDYARIANIAHEAAKRGHSRHEIDNAVAQYAYDAQVMALNSMRHSYSMVASKATKLEKSLGISNALLYVSVLINALLLIHAFADVIK